MFRVNHYPTFFPPIITGILLACTLHAFPACAAQLLTRKELTPAMARVLVQYARKRMTSTIRGTPFSPADINLPSEITSANNGVDIILIKNRKILGQAFARQATLIGNIHVAAARAVALANIEDTTKVTLLMTLLLKDKPFTKPPLSSLLRKQAALGVHGISAELRGMRQFMPPLIPLLRGWNWRQTMLNLAEGLAPVTSDGNTGAVDANKRKKEARLLKTVLMSSEFHLTLIPGITIASLSADNTPVILYRLGRIVPISAVTAKSVAQAIRRAQAWYRNNQKPNGLFPYLYNPLEDTYSTKRHLLRETMNTAAIGTLWRYTKDKNVRSMGLKNLKQILSESYLEDPKTGYGYLKNNHEPPSLGQAAAALYAIVQLRADKIDPVIQQQAEHLAKFINAMRRDDGNYNLRWPDDGDQSNTDYYPGEAQLALMSWALATKNTAQSQPCLASMRFYRSYFENSLRSGKTVPYPMVPWHTQACLKLYAATRRQEVADFIFAMNRLLVTIQQVKPMPGKFLPADNRGRFFSPRKRASGRPHVSSTAVYLEGLAEAMAMARALGEDKLAKKFRYALLWGARDLLQLQIKDEFDTLLMPKPKLAMGGFRTRLSHQTIRIDNMQHAVSALIKIAAVLKPEDYVLNDE